MCRESTPPLNLGLEAAKGRDVGRSSADGIQWKASRDSLVCLPGPIHRSPGLSNHKRVQGKHHSGTVSRSLKAEILYTFGTLYSLKTFELARSGVYILELHHIIRRANFIAEMVMGKKVQDGAHQFCWQRLLLHFHWISSLGWYA